MADLLILGNCMIRGLSDCLRVMMGGAHIKTVEWSEIVNKKVDLSEECNGSSVLLGSDGASLEALKAVASKDTTVLGFPTIYYTGFHPDTIYSNYGDGQNRLLSPTGTNHSAIVAHAWLNDMTPSETAGLFNERVFEHLGYFDHWQQSIARLRDQFEALGFNFDGRIEEWMKFGCFMHTPNHPKLLVVSAIAKVLLKELGINPKTANPENMLNDNLSSLVIWPVYPEIANRLGISGEYCFKREARFGSEDQPAPVLSLQEYIEASFEMYSHVSSEKFDFGRLSDVRYRDIKDLIFPRRLKGGKAISPYSSLPTSSFWRKSVAAIPPSDVDPVCVPKKRILKTDRIATAGSCFAQHIARRLQRSGYNYCNFEPTPNGTSDAEAFGRGYGVFSARYGNVYTVRQLTQLYDRAYGVFKPTDDIWENIEGRYIDPFRPFIEKYGFTGKIQFLKDREQHLSAVRDMFQSVDIFVFTLGLTEAWRSSKTGAIVPFAPGAVGIAETAEEYEFINFQYEDVRRDLKVFRKQLQLVNPKARIILTVSPVPLIATYEKQHILPATIYSKSVLVSAARDFEKECDEIDYFPSYEIIAGSFNRGTYFKDDLREITDSGVDHVMRIFFKHYVSPTDPQVSDQSMIARELAEGSKILCDEEALEAQG